MEHNETTLEALRRMARTPEEWGERQKAKLNKKLEGFEESVTSDPKDDVVGPVLATGSSMLRDMFLQPVDPDAMKVGAVPSPKLKRAVERLKRPPKDARTEALKSIANKKPTVQENLQRIDKLDDQQSIDLFDRLFGGANRTGLTPSEARRLSKMAVEGRGKEALEALKAAQNQPVIKRNVTRGLD